MDRALLTALGTIRATRHGYLGWPEPEALERTIARSLEGLDGDRRRDAVGRALERLLKLRDEREEVIRLAREDPFAHGFEWQSWQRADGCLPVRPSGGLGQSPALPVRLVAVLGGNRAGKTEYAVKRCMETLVTMPGSRIIFMCQKLETSRQVQQAYCWRYFPEALRRLNGKRDRKRVHYISYQQGTGFASEKFVLPNGSEGVFLVYTQDSADYEGIQIGCSEQRGAVGWYADESLPMDWLKLLQTRSATWDGTGLWTFTPLQGVTPALKEVLGTGKVLASREEAFFKGQALMPGLPPGHMPTVAEGSRPDIAVVWFHTVENPLGGYERLVLGLTGKPRYMAERALCGYARDTKGKVFSTFGSWNVVEEAAVPAVGTRYMHIDPHPHRNWFMLWVLVDPNGTVWAYDEWPDDGHFGEWAVPTERNPKGDSAGGWDGDAGPAQEAVGYGIAQYKNVMIECERRFGGEIYRRTIDRRAGPADVPVGSGPPTCLWQELNDEQIGQDGKALAPALPVELAGGPALQDDGLEMIRQALYVDMDKPIDPMRNYPRLFVSSRCRQLIWALENFTGRDGNKGACKDPIDCLRDMSTSGLESMSGAAQGAYGGGSY